MSAVLTPVSPSLEWITLIPECQHDPTDATLYELGDGRSAMVCGAVVAIALLPGGKDRVRRCLKRVHKIYEHRCPQCRAELVISRVGPGARSFRCPAGDHESIEVREVRT